ncbi:MAG: cofactor-independent phosphoglycerate mutase [Clostridia bacterium]|nr:cofactor-independent phosphoglycerate mutase [Clostridia bacterium]
MKYIVVLGDGMADRAILEFGGKTVLDVANKPNIDYMSENGELGMVKTVPDGMKPGSDVANLSVLGYDVKKCYSGRSPLEAASIGVDLKDNDVTFRANLVTLSDDEPFENKTMVDYSAGEISSAEAAELISTIEKELHTNFIHFYSGVSYRHLLVWTGGSTNVKLTPPHDISDKKIGDYLPNGDNGDKLLELLKRSNEILKNHPINQKRIKEGKRPATSLWFWGEGTKPQIELFTEKYGLKGSMISAVDLLKGIAICAKMKSIDVIGATGNWDTNFDGKAQAAFDTLTKDGADFVYIHMEAPDECGHQGNAEKKKLSVELIDKKVVGFLKKTLENHNIAYKMMILPDHPTPVSTKTHASEPVPYVIYSSDNSTPSGLKYCEENGKKTGVYFDSGVSLMKHFLEN